MKKEKTIKKITNIKDLRFNLTNNMRDLIIEIIIINQLLKENEKNTLVYKITDSGKIEWTENKGQINPNEILFENSNNVNKGSKAREFILGILSRGEIKGTELKELVIKIGGISEKTYNITKALLHKENIIRGYQKSKSYYWTLNNQTEE